MEVFGQNRSENLSLCANTWPGIHTKIWFWLYFWRKKTAERPSTATAANKLNQVKIKNKMKLFSAFREKKYFKADGVEFFCCIKKAWFVKDHQWAAVRSIQHAYVAEPMWSLAWTCGASPHMVCFFFTQPKNKPKHDVSLYTLFPEIKSSQAGLEFDISRCNSSPDNAEPPTVHDCGT